MLFVVESSRCLGRFSRARRLGNVVEMVLVVISSVVCIRNAWGLRLVQLRVGKWGRFKVSLKVFHFFRVRLGV